MPEWLPNIHPMVVHFPIALLILAVLVDIAGLFLRRYLGVQLVAVGLYLVGAVGTLTAYLTGQRAVETVDIPAQAVSAIASHEDWALYTLIFFSVYAILRVSVTYLRPHLGMVPQIVLVLIGAIGLWPLMQASDRGGELVFAHGIGVQPVGELQAELEGLREADRIAQAAPVEENGSWNWRVTAGSDEVLTSSFDWLRGSPEDVDLEISSNEDESSLIITMRGNEALVVYGEDVESAELSAQLNLGNFDGTIALVHNVTSADDFHYLSFDGERMVQGRIVEGSDDEVDEGEVTGNNSITLRATGSDGHFYGYFNDETVTHGHSSTPAPGRTGFLIRGEGTLALHLLEVNEIE